MKSVSAEDHPDFPSIKWSRLELVWIRERDRQWEEQLAAALAACKVKDEALADTLYFLERHSNRWDGVNGKHPNDVACAARDALAIQPDASALNSYKHQVIAEFLQRSGQYLTNEATRSEYRNQVIEECAKHLEHLEYMYAALTVRELKR